MGILRGTLTGIVTIWLFSPLASAETQRQEPEEERAISHNKSADRAVDHSKVTVFQETYSRGNDDIDENRFGVYETALLKNKLITKLENGKLQVVVEVEPKTCC